MSGVAYLLFISGILSGNEGEGLITTNLFPYFKDTTEFNADLLQQFKAIKPASMQDTGKLLVWCFLAGYSEHFIVRVLNHLEQKSP